MSLHMCVQACAQVVGGEAALCAGVRVAAVCLCERGAGLASGPREPCRARSLAGGEPSAERVLPLWPPCALPTASVWRHVPVGKGGQMSHESVVGLPPSPGQLPVHWRVVCSFGRLHSPVRLPRCAVPEQVAGRDELAGSSRPARADACSRPRAGVPPNVRGPAKCSRSQLPGDRGKGLLFKRPGQRGVWLSGEGSDGRMSTAPGSSTARWSGRLAWRRPPLQAQAQECKASLGNTARLSHHE